MAARIYKSKSVKYMTVGLTAFLVEYGSFTLFMASLSPTGVSLLGSQVLSFCCGLATSFLGSREHTFKSARKDYKHSIKMQLGAYALLALINLVLSSLLLYMLAHSFQWAPWLAKLLVMAMVAVWNFAIFNRIIFQHKASR